MQREDSIVIYFLARIVSERRYYYLLIFLYHVERSPLELWRPAAASGL